MGLWFRIPAGLAAGLLLAACPTPGGDDDSGDDDDVAMDDDSGDDDDSASLPAPCAWALAHACADVVVDAPFASGTGNGDPLLAVNGVRGAGATAGGTDVYSMGVEPDGNSVLVLRWSGRAVVDGPGVDVVVFENAFAYGDGLAFMDLAVVEVSRDGLLWAAFPHDCTAEDETTYSADPDDWPGFAGRSAVLLHEEDNPTDPLDPAQAGGDGFDIADLPADGGPGDEVRAMGILLLRIRSAASLANPDTGAPWVHDPISNGPDIDGVYARTLVVDEG